MIARFLSQALQKSWDFKGHAAAAIRSAFEVESGSSLYLWHETQLSLISPHRESYDCYRGAEEGIALE
jgi:hypothetical protein